MNQHLTRLVEARLHYFASVGAILAERHFDRPNCLMDAILGQQRCCVLDTPGVSRST